jgi:hypothetical protein
MSKYQNGKIYSIHSSESDKIYIGSTISTLTKRLSEHTKDYNRWKSKSTKYVSSFIILDCEDYYIELIESFPCNNIQELKAREGYFQRKIECVNLNIAGRTKLQYYQENKEAINKKNKIYNDNHIEEIKKYQQQYRSEHKEHTTEYNLEYYKNNQDALILHQREYKLNNLQKIKDRRKIKTECVCGSIYNLDAKCQHIISKKHLKFIEQK